MSLIEEKVAMEGLTFDDVLLIPAYSEVLPREVDLQILKKHPTQHSYRVRCYGHSNRSADGHRSRKRRRYRRYS